MARIIPLITLIPTIFTFIAIILINVGGVGLFVRSGYVNPRNTDFDLLRWNYTISPGTSAFYSSTLYLHRQCTGGQARLSAQRGGSVSEQCPSWATKMISDRSPVVSANYLLSSLRPFNFDTVNLNAPFALYVVAAVFVTLAMLTGLTAAAQGKNNRLPRIFGAVFSMLSFIFVLAASAVITRQTLHLADQIRNDTAATVRRTSTNLGSPSGAQTTYTIDIISVSVGRPVQGLTWAAVVAMLIATVLWAFAALKAKSYDAPPPAYKEERLSTSPSDRYVQGGV